MGIDAMKRLSIRDVRRELSQIDELIRREGELLITRRGRPIARILPIKSEQMPQSHAALRATMRRLQTGSEVIVRGERDER